jgi:hypothetical protein
MGCGRYPGWTATIFPFKDNPTFGLPVVFYAVPATNPDGPASPFVDRFWDNRENWFPNGVGMDPTSFKVYLGPLPGPAVAPLVGTADQWANGLSYATWLAGGYSNPNGSVTIATQFARARLASVESILFDTRVRATLASAENLNAWSTPAAVISEAEALWTGSAATVSEAEALWTGSAATVSEAESIDLPGADATTSEAEDLTFGGAAATVSEAEDVVVYTSPPSIIYQGSTNSGSANLTLAAPHPELIGLLVTGPCILPGTQVVNSVGNVLTLTIAATCTTTSNYLFHM